MDQGRVIDCVRTFADKTREALEVQQVILFGSHVKGTAREDSDIDVAVITDAPVADWLTTAATLFRIAGDINLDLEPHLLDSASDRSGFLAHLRRTGQVIYDRDADQAAT
jgi:predicted nucleotidyltransferase